MENKEKRYALFIYPDGTGEALPWDTEDGLELIQEKCGGDVEAVPTFLEGFVMLVNEEGKLLGLPANVAASSALAFWIPDIIAGTAAVVRAEREDLRGMSREELCVFDRIAGKPRGEKRRKGNG